MVDYLIVGAGLTGCVLAERIASQCDQRVLVVDVRDHIGGNASDYFNEHGILVHRHGPHWFHTNDKDIFDYLSRFTAWHYHSHIVRAYVDGQLLPIPINMDTINRLYGMTLRSPQDVEAFLDSVREHIPYPQNAEEMVLSRVGRDLYGKFFRGYTIKQWALDPTRLAASVTARIPVYTNRDCRYFTDTYQAVPLHGYHRMFARMLSHPNISVILQTDYRSIIGSITFNRMIYTGPIDTFFDCVYGALPYWSLRFEHETYDVEFYQPVQQINYPNNYDFSRTIEWKHATGQQHDRTTVTREYPTEPSGLDDRYYPVPNDENDERYQQYRRQADRLESVLFAGRLADYKYYNMDQAVACALNLFQTRVA
jgi:UDP-galactopyranose mutase